MKRFAVIIALVFAPLSWADWAADRDASAGYVTVTTLATAVDEAVPFVYVALSELPADFHTAMTAASDTDGKTIRVSTSDGATQLACVPLGVNTSTDTGALFFLGTGMSASSDVDYRIYVGNSGLTMPTASGGMGEQAVFAAYEGVYFPGMDTRDFTDGGRTLTAVNSPGTAASGYEGITAATYNGTDEYHHYNGTQAVTAWPMSLEGLIYSANTTSTYRVFGISKTTDASLDQMYMRFRGSGGSGDRIEAYFAGGSGSGANAETSTSYSATTWTYVAGTRDTTTGDSSAYISGGSQGLNGTTIAAISAPDEFGIGAQITTSILYANGRVAVTLLSSSVRSANYVATMADNWATTMYSVGSWTAASSCTSGSTGWVLLQTTGQSTSADVDWTNLANAIIDDATVATAALDDTSAPYSEYANITNIAYGTTIPTDAIGYTLEFRIKRYRETGGGFDIRDLTVQMIDETGTRVGDNLAKTTTDWGTAAASTDYIVTGETIDGADFDADTGVAIRADASSSSNPVDAYLVTVWARVTWVCDAGLTTGFFELGK